MSRVDAYAQALELLAEDFKAWALHNPRGAPRFRLAPKGVMVVAPLGAVPRVCGNADARACVEYLVTTSRTRFGPEREPSVFMLDVVLEHLGLDVERVGLSELGLKVGAA